LERRGLQVATGIVVVSEASRDLYATRYPLLVDRVHVIPNGFDPEDLPEAGTYQASADGRIHFLHAGSLRYPQRSPAPFFEAFGRAAVTDARLVLHLLGSISPANEALARSMIPAAHLSIDG